MIFCFRPGLVIYYTGFTQLCSARNSSQHVCEGWHEPCLSTNIHLWLWPTKVYTLVRWVSIWLAPDKTAIEASARMVTTQYFCIYQWVGEWQIASALWSWAYTTIIDRHFRLAIARCERKRGVSRISDELDQNHQSQESKQRNYYVRVEKCFY